MKYKGKVILEKINFKEDELVIAVSTSSHNPADIHDPTFKRFLNICVGSPNLTKYKTEEKRNERFELGKKMLLEKGYVVEERIRRK